jgi:polysaccharide pyruvyl transferase WcaK-like protein
MKTIHFISASDRLNYGDLIFILVFKKIFNNSTQIYNYGLIKSDLSHFGALPTESFKTLEQRIKKLKKDNSQQVIIIGGGHAMFPSWTTLYSHISNWFNLISKFIFLKKILNKLNFPRIVFTNHNHISPFLPDLGLPLIYNSVGGSVNFKTAKGREISRVLNSETLINVRDNYLYNQLKANVISCNLVPDTAILISDLYSKEDLKDKVSNSVHQIITQKFIFVQFGLTKDPEDYIRFSETLNFFKKQNIKILLSPIGLAKGHEDDTLLKRLAELNPDFIYYHPKSLYETMLLIASSECYLGTSLHGCITAFSFEVKFIPLNSKVKKLKNYLNTWWGSFLPYIVDYENLSTYLENDYKDYNLSLLQKSLINQKKIVYKAFNEMENFIKEQKKTSNDLGN